MVLVVSGYIYIFLASVYVLFGRRYRQGQPWSSASRAPVQGRNCFGSTSSFANRDRGDLSLSSGPVPCPSVAALLISLLTSEIAAEIIQNSTEFYRICRCRSPLQSSVRSSLSFLGTLALSTQFRRKMGTYWI